MIEKAVVNASMLTVTLAIVGFGILTLAHHYENDFGEQFPFLERFVGFSDSYQMAYQTFALRFLETVSKGLEKLDKRVERFERLSIEGRDTKECKDIVSPNYPMAFVLFLFVCGLFSASQGCVVKEMQKNKTGKNKKKNKWRNKNRKKMRKRRIALKTTKRSKKRY
jgi:hypothetical protein